MVAQKHAEVFFRQRNPDELMGSRASRVGATSSATDKAYDAQDFTSYA